MDSYLNRFEKFAVSQNADKTTWALSLSALLRGRALDVYSMMSKDDVNDYDKLKTALLKRYQLTADGFRKRFVRVQLAIVLVFVVQVLTPLHSRQRRGPGPPLPIAKTLRRRQCRVCVYRSHRIFDRHHVLYYRRQRPCIASNTNTYMRLVRRMNEGTSAHPTRYRMQTSRAAVNHSHGHAHVGDLS